MKLFFLFVLKLFLTLSGTATPAAIQEEGEPRPRGGHQAQSPPEEAAGGEGEEEPVQGGVLEETGGGVQVNSFFCGGFKYTVHGVVSTNTPLPPYFFLFFPFFMPILG